MSELIQVNRRRIAPDLFSKLETYNRVRDKIVALLMTEDIAIDAVEGVLVHVIRDIRMAMRYNLTIRDSGPTSYCSSDDYDL